MNKISFLLSSISTLQSQVCFIEVFAFKAIIHAIIFKKNNLSLPGKIHAIQPIKGKWATLLSPTVLTAERKCWKELP